MKTYLKTAFLNTLPVMAGYMVLGFGFGILSVKAGYGIWWVLLMSLFIYAGSMQYVLLGLLAEGASVLTVALTTLMVNARHLFYGISIIEPYKNMKGIKPYLIFGLTDETYSLLCSGKAPEGLEFKKYSFLVTLFDHVYWVTGSLLGAIFGASINFNSNGVEFAMTALFITIFTEQWKSTKEHLPTLTGVLSSVICLIVFGKSSFLIPSMILISIILMLLMKKTGKEDA